MKISLWQQFSSNHSSSCFIVGQFESEEKAQQVEQEMRILLQSIIDWWQQFPESAWDTIANDLLARGLPTPPEQAYKEKYALKDWSTTIFIDWLWDQTALEALHRVGTLVSINQMASSISSWDGISPFEEIFQKWGGKIMMDVAEGDIPLKINFRGTAPDEHTAQNIMAQAHQQLENDVWTIVLPGLHRTQGEIDVEGSEIILTDYRFQATSYLYVDSSFEKDFKQLLATLTDLGLSDIRYEIVPYKE
jgi:hypothetical protein